MKIPKILPCPFCGGEGKAKYHGTDRGAYQNYVVCLKCEASTSHYYSKAIEAIAAWNMRDGGAIPCQCQQPITEESP